MPQKCDTFSGKIKFFSEFSLYHIPVLLSSFCMKKAPAEAGARKV
jgi:hypothetical protein